MMRFLSTCTAALCLLLFSSPWAVAAAESAAQTTPTAERGGLVLIDWVIIGAYAVLTIGLGAYYGRKQESTEEYFIGSGKMNPILVGISLFATLLSTISYLSMPGEALGKGPVNSMTIFALPLVYLAVAYLIIPVYMKQRVTSAYELLELKLGVSIRLLGAVMFVALRLVWMSLLIFLSSKALVSMMDVPEAQQEQWIRWVALAAGLVAVIYTSVGGLSAVVITDFLQTLLLFGGALLVIGTVTYQLGGIDWFPTDWQEHWDRQPIFDIDPRTRVTAVGTVGSFLLWYICTAGGDQTSVQRFMATEDVSAARRALATQLVAAALVAITLTTVGFALMGYFRAHPELVAGGDVKKAADDLFPQYIAFELPPGISGLVVAAMFAAAMSSIDSGVNSITAVVMTDFLDRFGLKPKSERQHVLIARILAFSIGAIVVIGSAYMGAVPGNITAVTGKTTNLLTTPIFALFFFALFVPFATTAGVWIGSIAGVSVAVLVAFSGPILVFLNQQFGVDPGMLGVDIVSVQDKITGAMKLEAKPDPFSFQWIAPCAFTTNVVVGLIASYLTSRRDLDSSADQAAA